MIKFAHIDNIPFEIHDGESILTFVNRNFSGQFIPTLCQAPNLKPIGACRICSVEIEDKLHEGKKKIVAACHTPVAENMKIFTHTDRIEKLRKNIVELILTDHPLDCLICEANGNCELQTVAARVGIRDVRYPKGKTHLDTPSDLSHTYMRSDLSKCINCHRCIQACDEIQGEFVLSMAGRGFDSHIIKGLNESFEDSACVSCGACAQTCPTSAISDVFQSKAIDAEKVVRTICPYCGVGCNLDIAVKNQQVLHITAPYDSEVNQGHTCLKGRYAFRFYNHPDRLKQPMIRKNGSFQEVGWEEAYDLIASKLTTIKTKFGPDSIAGISSSRCTNEENYLMQKFIRAVIGTNNIDGCARICHAPTAAAMQRTFGTGAATNSIVDLKFTDCMIVIGANPTTAHPVTGAKIKQQAIKGKTLIVVDPRKTELARYADYHLQLRPGTNVALLNMLMYFIISEGLVDLEFIANRCDGYEDLKQQILSLDIDQMALITGVDKELVKQAAVAYASAKNAMSFHGLGVTEHTQGTFGVIQVANLAMLTGNIGRPGVGVNPLRGQNNVQGAADMGVQPNQGAGYMDITNPDFNELYENHYGRKLSSKIGWTIPEMFDAATDGKLKALWIMGENVLQTEPNTQKVEQALESIDFLVVQELFMTDTAKKADVVLPGASFLEKSGTFTNGERRVQRVNKAVEPIGNSKADGLIMTEIMNKMGYDQAEYDPEIILDEISAIVPFFKGIRWQELGEQGKQWPVAENGQDTKILHVDSFKHGNGKLFFHGFAESNELIQHSAKFPFILTTNRALEHYNCGTMTRRTGDTEILGEDLLLMNEEDANDKSISDGEVIKLSSERGEINIRVKISDMVKPGILSTTFHFPEQLVNKITSDELDTEATCPEYKVVAVDIQKS